MSTVRCPIYTRKSSEDGLEQEFNSLDAQYEACKAYLTSQKHEGWSLNRERYDDGGFSGGSMERPGLRALLADVLAGKIDVVIIYKIDRLTRSLADFARIVEVLEKSGASFVSVTQSFNTKNSMGRLMLHVLLSFAQFEREVGAERVRDKIAASKAKGMWMGGTMPLGYDAIDKKLVINEAEAATVRILFETFVQLKSVHATLRWTQEQGLRTKPRVRLGQQVGGAPFHYGALRCILSNPLYAGDVTHKGRAYPGQHASIVDRELFDEAQRALARLKGQGRQSQVVSVSLLRDLLLDAHDRPMGPAHTLRNGQRFRYYVTHHRSLRKDGPPAYRLAADALERHCAELVSGHLKAQVNSVEGHHEATRIAAVLSTGDVMQRRELMLNHVCQIRVGAAELTLKLHDGSTLCRSLARVRDGQDVKLVVGELSTGDQPKCDPQIVAVLRDAMRARQLALAEPALTLEQLASEFGRSPDRYKRLLRLSYLAPSVFAALLSSSSPAHLNAARVRQLDRLPLSWADQERMLLA